MICSRCGKDHATVDYLAESRAETRTNEDIHRMLDRGEDDGRRPNNAAFLCMVRYMQCLLKDDPEPRVPYPTAWEALLQEDGI